MEISVLERSDFKIPQIQEGELEILEVVVLT